MRLCSWYSPADEQSEKDVPFIVKALLAFLPDGKRAGLSGRCNNPSCGYVMGSLLLIVNVLFGFLALRQASSHFCHSGNNPSCGYVVVYAACVCCMFE